MKYALTSVFTGVTNINSHFILNEGFIFRTPNYILVGIT